MKRTRTLREYSRSLLLGLGFIFVILLCFFSGSDEPVQLMHPEEIMETTVRSLELPVNFEDLVRDPLEQNHYLIRNYILENGYLLEPTARDIPYNLKEPSIDPSKGQSAVIKKIFGGMRGGFFIECGALDGEIRSNTLALERDYGWNGLLIEGDPSNYELVLNKKRKAWTAGCCLAIHPYPHEVMFQQQFNLGRIKETDKNKFSRSKLHSRYLKQVKVKCFPIFSLLSAMNVTKVDYFSLDVEGDELEVLKTIPFDLVEIKALSVEFGHGKGGALALQDFMESKGYNVAATVTSPGQLANDLIFVHKSIDTYKTLQ